ncbi:hypothetical protein ILYODFUR_032441 [Ilyodon furcidens]|uniref:Uncharacterized protein n=1 Tax=Ilyodon furcidens TaxID=33524 RepID=A0ABV0TGS8_9TELE
MRWRQAHLDPSLEYFESGSRSKNIWTSRQRTQDQETEKSLLRPPHRRTLEQEHEGDPPGHPRQKTWEQKHKAGRPRKMKTGHAKHWLDHHRQDWRQLFDSAICSVQRSMTEI